MRDPDVDLRDIVARATFLRERLDQSRYVDRRKEKPSSSRLDRWRSAVEPPGTDWFEKRLQWDGLDAATVHSVLEDQPREPGRPLPDWALVLRDISEAASNIDSTVLEPSPVDSGAPMPFEHLLLPALIVGRKMVCTRLGLEPEMLRFPVFGMISANAYRALERGLLRHLSSIAGRTLESEFRRALPFGRSLCLALGVGDVDSGGDACYREFVREHLESGWLKLMRKYPVLGRLIALAVEFWAAATVELLQRLATDARLLAKTFLLSTTSSLQVTGFEVSLGDRHRNGRSVVIVEFAGGEKVAYKPKPLGTEVTFNRLLEWCNQRGTVPELRVVTVLDRGAYGWVECLQHLPCVEESGAERFYVRAGMLLCLLHVARATDCHYENLIAHGEHPVLIDAETLLYPDPQPLDHSSALEPGEPLGDRLLAGSVLRTGLLPRWEADNHRAHAHDISGLGGVVPELASRNVLRWDRTNTDDMVIDYAGGVIEPRYNVARIDERTLSPLDYEMQLIEGFCQMYRFLMAHAKALSTADGPLLAMREHSVRYLYRSTYVYATLIGTSWSPACLRNGIEYGIHLEQLARAFLTSSGKPNVWPAFAAEVRAMEQMDVPLFMARVDGNALNLDDGTTVPDAFTRSGYDSMQELVANMTEADLEGQILVIRAALRVKAARPPSDNSAEGHPVNIPPAPLLERVDLVSAAKAIGLEIERHALTDGENGMNWIGSNYLESAGRYRLGVLSDSMYDGCCGVALFLAALAKATGEERFAALALRSLHVLRRRLRGLDPSVRRVAARLYGVGGAIGLGSVIYSFTRVAVFLDDDSDLLDDAAALAEWLSPSVISADERLDVMSGAAGALLGLLTLYSVGGAASVLDKAVECGDHLLLRTSDFKGHRAWRTIGDRLLTGFSHGAAGIAYALVRLYHVTGNQVYLDAAVRGIEFERAVFSARHGNWPDLRPARPEGASGFPVKWCHGAAGIALARLGCRKIADIPGIDSEIDIALRTTRKKYLQDTDFLCCGNLGRAETFLVAGCVTGRPEWRQLAADGVARVVARATDCGGYRVFTASGLYDPGFFHGTAGIGYQLLRLGGDDLPSVLMWE